MAIQIKPMSIRDYDRALALWQASEGVAVGASDGKEDIRRYLRRNPGLSLAAYDGRRLVGVVLCGHDGRRGILHHLAVDKSSRGRGLGRRLVDACMKRLKRAGIRRCWIMVLKSNPGGMRFWKATGWTQMSEVAGLKKDL